MINEFSYRDENQAIFGAWYDGLSDDIRAVYYAEWQDGALNIGAVLAASNQAAGWTDSFLDQLSEWHDDKTGIKAVREAHHHALTLCYRDDVPIDAAMMQAAAKFGVDVAAIRAMNFDE